MVPKLVNDIMDENAKEETAGIEQDQVEFSEPQEAPQVDEGGLMRFRQLATPRDGGFYLIFTRFVRSEFESEETIQRHLLDLFRLGWSSPVSV